MLQQEQPEDYVIASGESHSVREFLDIAFHHIGLDYHQYLVTDPELYRPSEIHILRGDASKARQRLKWLPTVSFRDLVVEMVDRDLELHSKHPSLV